MNSAADKTENSKMYEESDNNTKSRSRYFMSGNDKRLPFWQDSGKLITSQSNLSRRKTIQKCLSEIHLMDAQHHVTKGKKNITV